jgi:hypothetical protein
MSLPNDASSDPKVFQWTDARTMALTNIDEDVMLVMKVQTENIGITPGTLIASGKVDMTSFELFTKLNAAKQYQQKRSFELNDTNGQKCEIVLKIKFIPKEAPKQPEPVPAPEEEAP